MGDVIDQMYNDDQKLKELLLEALKKNEASSLDSTADYILDCLYKLSSTDNLTGLVNRIYGEKIINSYLESGQDGTFGILDVDRFREVNTKFGHQVGDKLLVAIAKVMRQYFPESTMLVRLGADEFAFNCTQFYGHEGTSIGVLAQKLFKELRDIKIPELGDYRFSISISVYKYKGSKTLTYDTLYNIARNLCNRSKLQEGNYMFFNNLGIPDVEQAFQLLEKDKIIYNKLNDQLFSINNEESWKEYLKKSAKLNTSMCERNQKQFDQIVDYYTRDDVPADDYNMLYSMVRKYHSTLDSFMMEVSVKSILLPFYEKQEPTHEVCCKLAFMYMIMGESDIAMFHMGDDEAAFSAIDFLKKCVKVTDNFVPGTEEFEFRMYAMFHIIGQSMLGINKYWKLGFREIDSYALYLYDLFVSDNPIRLRDNYLYRRYKFLIQITRLYAQLRSCELCLTPNRTRLENYELARKMVFLKNTVGDDEQHGLVYTNMKFMRVKRTLTEVLFKKRTPTELFLYLRDILVEVRDESKVALSTTDLTAMTCMFMAAAMMLRISDFDAERKRSHTIEAWNFILTIFKRRKSEAMDTQSSYMAQLLVSLMVQSTMIPMSDKFEMLPKSMGILMVNTYSHSIGVAAYSKLITANIIDNFPEMLLGATPLCGSIDDIKKNREEILRFVYNACILHDIGKIRQIPIISNCYRKLTPHEFRLLKKHPELGVEYIGNASELQQYVPVILGHHKWFDGKKGYPDSCDNNSMPEKIIVDIVTICDSLEAATSKIGRNYRVEKQYCTVIDELYSQAGTRYNADVLRSLISSPEAYIKLRSMVENNWENIYSSIYREIVEGVE